MHKVNIREARRDISRLLDEVAAGEEVIIVRRGTPVARLLKIVESASKALRFPDRSVLRAQLPPRKENSAVMLKEMRDERG